MTNEPKGDVTEDSAACTAGIAKPQTRLPTRFRKRVYPECEIGGYARNDSQLVYLRRVHSLLLPSSVVLDYGAGRGEWDTHLPAIDEKRSLMRYQAHVARVYGCDVDPAVATNPWLDEALIMSDGSSLDLADRSIDVVSALAVFEHLPDPAATERELQRVVRRGGWVCAWTPARWNYVAVAARVIPNRHHISIVQRATPERLPEDVFPTKYRLNTKRQLARVFDPSNWESYSYYFSGPPGYHANSNLLAWGFHGLDRVLPGPMQRHLHVFLRRR